MFQEMQVASGGGMPCDSGTIAFVDTNNITVPLSFTPTKVCIWAKNASSNQYVSVNDNNTEKFAIIGSTQAWSVSSITLGTNEFTVAIPSSGYINVPINWIAVKD